MHRPGAWGEKVTDSKWTGGSHEIRRISVCSGLVFSLVYRLLSRKTPSFADFGTNYGDLSYSIAYELARKQGLLCAAMNISLRLVPYDRSYLSSHRSSRQIS